MTPITFRRILLIPVFFILLISSMAVADSTIETSVSIIEGSRKGLGPEFSFQFDNNWTPSAAYYDLESMDLKFAQVRQGRWVIEKVAPAGYSENGQKCSLKFDKSNKPYISYYSDKKTLHLARKENDSWVTEEIDHTSPSGLYCSMTLSDGNEPSISYQSNSGTMIARKLIGSWLVQKIDEEGLATLIHQPPGGNTVVYYILRANRKGGNPQILKSAENNGTGWTSKVVPGTGGCLDFNVSFDRSGSPYIAYTRGGSIRMYRESVPGSGIWKEEEIEAAHVTSLSILPVEKGFPVICYISGNGTELKVARFDGSAWDVKKAVTTKSGFKLLNCVITADSRKRELLVISNGDSLNVLIKRGEGWALGRIDGRIRAGAFINLSLLKNDMPLVCYFSPAQKSLYFASQDSTGKWTPQVIDAVGNVGHYADMKTDDAGNPMIVYYDKSRGDLKFTRQGTPGNWITDRIDTGKDTGLFPSMAVTAGGSPVVSYYGKSQKSLKYAYLKGRKWITEKVAHLGSHGGPSVILTDSSENPVIFFIDGDRLKKPSPNQSPVTTSVKMAVKRGKNWIITPLTGPQDVSIRDQTLSGSSGPDGSMAISFIDREDNLRVLEKVGNQWKNHTAATGCLGPAVIRYNGSTPSVLFVWGKNPENSELKLARMTESGWIVSNINTTVKIIRHIDMAFGADGLMRIAAGDQENFFATLITEKKRTEPGNKNTGK